MCPQTWLVAEDHGLTWVFLCDVTLPRGRRLSFLGHPYTASEDLGDAPSFSESFHWCGNHPVKETGCKFMPQDFRIKSLEQMKLWQRLYNAFPYNILLDIIFFRTNLKQGIFSALNYRKKEFKDVCI